MQKHHLAASFFAQLAVVLVVFAAGPSLGQLSSATPEYKCYVSMADNSDTILFFYQQGDLPERFSDHASVAEADIPDSVREELVRVHECVLRHLEFFDPAAVKLEMVLPQ